MHWQEAPPSVEPAAQQDVEGIAKKAAEQADHPHAFTNTFGAEPRGNLRVNFV